MILLGNIIGVTGIAISVLLVVLFAIGLWYSKIHMFKQGVYFFLLLIIHEVYLLVSPPVIQSYIDNLGGNKPLLGLTIGEFIAFSSLIPKILLIAAFLFLIVGLRNFKNAKRLSSK